MGDKGDEEKSAGGPIEVCVFGRTDVGLVREHNEDNFLVADMERGNRSLLPEVRDHEVGPGGSLLAVCDGMGGAAAGEVASQIAVDTVYELMDCDEPPDGVEGLALLIEAAILDAGKRIFQSAKADRTRRGMGTTITAGALISDRMIFGQVGDSRAYVVRQGALAQVTRDQSLVNQLIEAGQLKPEEAELFEHSNIILQALGTAEDVTVDLTYVDLRRGDRVILCSDGLSGLVTDEMIRQLVVENPEPIQACKALTEAAREGGGHDNITVIVAQFEGKGLAVPTDEDLVEFQRLELPGRVPLASKQPPVAAPEWAPPSDDDARASDPSASPAPAEPAPARGGAKKRDRKKSEGNPLFMGIAVVAVLAVGVGLGFLIVSGTVSGDADSDVDAPAVVEPQPQLIACRFTSNVPGSRLIIDGTDYREAGADGWSVELAAGQHSVELRHGTEVIAQQQLVLEEGQDPGRVYNIEATVVLPSSDAGTAQAGEDADLGESDDGGPKPPDADTRELPGGDAAPTEPDTGTPAAADAGELPRMDTGAVVEPQEPRPRPRPEVRPRPRPRPRPDPRPRPRPDPRPRPRPIGVDPNPYD